MILEENQDTTPRTLLSRSLEENQRLSTSNTKAPSLRETLKQYGISYAICFGLIFVVYLTLDSLVRGASDVSRFLYEVVSRIVGSL